MPMPTIIVFGGETTLVVDEATEEAVHQLSEASRGGRYALLHKNGRPHHVNPASVGFVTEADPGEDPVKAP
jgi:hypothetical protein